MLLVQNILINCSAIHSKLKEKNPHFQSPFVTLLASILCEYWYQVTIPKLLGYSESFIFQIGEFP